MEKEIKNYKLNELNALKNMKKYNTRPEGDVVICEREFKDSVSVDLKPPSLVT